MPGGIGGFFDDREDDSNDDKAEKALFDAMCSLFAAFKSEIYLAMHRCCLQLLLISVFFANVQVAGPGPGPGPGPAEPGL